MKHGSDMVSECEGVERTVWDPHKGTLKVFNWGRRKIISEESLRGKKMWAMKW